MTRASWSYSSECAISDAAITTKRAQGVGGWVGGWVVDGQRVQQKAKRCEGTGRGKGKMRCVRCVGMWELGTPRYCRERDRERQRHSDCERPTERDRDGEGERQRGRRRERELGIEGLLGERFCT